jgi:hypothetical protein
LWELLQLAAAATFTPLRVWAENLVETRFPRGLLIWAGFMWLLGVVVWLVWVGAGGQRRSVTVAVFWLLLAIGSVGSILGDDPLRVVLLFAAIAVFVSLTYRLAGMRGFQLLTIWAVFVAIFFPVASAVTEQLTFQESDLQAAPPVIAAAFTSHPDIVVLVSDAHGAFSVLADLYGFETAPAIKRLEESGLGLNAHMKANYSLTHLSLPSFFEMGYPVENGDIVSQGDLVELHEAVGGQNQLVGLFKSEGYQFVMVEPGWAGGRCAAIVDVCVASPFPDEATSFAIGRSVFGVGRSFLKESGPAAALSTLRWLEEELPTYLANGRPDFVFAHLFLPHPPLRLGEDCDFEWKAGLGGLSVGIPGLDNTQLALRKAAYIDQVECAQTAMAKVASLVSEDAIFLTFGDHGPDSRAQLFRNPSDWSQADVDERMQAFFAAKAASCRFDDVTSLVNVGRRLLECLTDSAIPDVEDRYFLATEATQSGEPLPVYEVLLPPRRDFALMRTG